MNKNTKSLVLWGIILAAIYWAYKNYQAKKA